nr:hypothetical protein [Pseudomonas aeruginosa]
MAASTAARLVPHAPGDHVGEEGEQDEGADQVGEHPAGAVVAVDVVEGMGEDPGDVGFLGRYRGQHAEGAEDVEGADDQPGDQHRARDVAARVAHLRGAATGQLGPHDAIDHHSQRGHLARRGRDDGVQAEVVGEAMVPAEVQAADAQGEHREQLEQRAEVRQPLAQAQRDHVERRGEQRQGYADGDLAPEAQLGEIEGAEHAAEQGVDRRHPQCVVDPVHP